MSAVSAAEFKSHFPGRFTKVPEPEIQRIIDRVERSFCPADVWGDRQVDGIMLRTAHTLDLEYIQAAEIGALSNSTVRGEAPKISTQSPSEDSLDLTIYGKQFKEIRDSLVTLTGFPY